ncbi:MAG: hypothetical protein KBT03_08000 [Bacteroidales bacterium]|nr:hypothetical protein [Candidatus Scybalousia scybalohippi]
MSKYNVWLPYKFFVTKTVEAENKEEAIEKVVDELGCDSISLCYQCMRDEDISDNPCLIEDEIDAEEV